MVDEDEGIWAPVPLELRLDIFNRLDNLAAVIRCAGTCKAWRRAVTSTAGFCPLRLLPDRFNPNLLAGVIYTSPAGGNVRIQLSSSAVNATADGTTILAAAAAGGLDLAVYDKPLSSRDGLVLLGSSAAGGDLCLWNPLAAGPQSSTLFLPAAALMADCTYVLITGDDDGNLSAGGVTILAVDLGRTTKSKTTYQYQLFVAGAWGAVKSSSELEGKKQETRALMEYIYPGAAVVCRGAAYWLGDSSATATFIGGVLRLEACRVRTLAIDPSSGKAWTTELPEQCRWPAADDRRMRSVVLATSGDGELSVLKLLCGGHQIMVWVLAAGEERWTPRRTVDVQWPDWSSMSLKAFCPRSGLVAGEVEGQEVLVDVETGSVRTIGGYHGCGTYFGFAYAYEMDWSTYISKMKRF